jgi:hypothetical protein
MSVSKLSATAPSPDEFRAFADEAADWARAARSDKERGIFLQMARTWLEAAETLEPPPRLPVVARRWPPNTA